MCGIVGTTHPQELEPGDLERMTNALAHRGPDALGTWADESVALGHRRLSVLDLSDRGAQPMTGPAGRIVVVFNGEIYNHRELRRTLPDVPWRGDSDTETLAALLEARGLAALDSLVGMFAFAAWDREARRLWLVRDRLGIKPLLVWREKGRLAFASEMTALRQHPMFQPRLNRRALHEYFLFNYVPGPPSLLENVHHLPPGHYLDANLATGQSTLRAWWRVRDQLGRRDEGPKRRSFAACAEQLDALLADSVRLRTLSDVPLGCFLSGGVDSSAVAAVLKAEQSIPTHTFTIGFEQARYDESARAARAARAIGTHHECWTMRREDYLRLIPTLGKVLDEPLADAAVIPTLLLSQRAREHVTVVLTGDGGDELFRGYERYAWALGAAKLGSMVPGPLRRAASKLLGNAPHYRLGMKARAFSWRHPREIYGNIFIGWNAAFADAVTGQRKNFAAHPIHQLGLGLSGAMFSPDVAGSLIDLQHYLPGALLSKIDRATMHVGLEARVPLLDHRIVEFALALPDAMHRRGSATKPLLREVLRRRGLGKLLEGPKQGFAVPLAPYFRGSLRPLVGDLLAGDRLRRQGHLQPDAVARLLARHQSGRWNHERQILALVVFQLWHDEVFG